MVDRSIMLVKLNYSSMYFQTNEKENNRNLVILRLKEEVETYFLNENSANKGINNISKFVEGSECSLPSRIHLFTQMSLLFTKLA